MGAPRLVGSRYAVGTMLGKGGMGEVYEATDETTGRKVALKLLRIKDAGSADDEGASEESEREWEVRFEREARMIGAMRSPHVVEVLDAGIDQPTSDRYLVMERLFGEDLVSLLRRLGPMPVELALRLAAQALLGLERAHATGIVHRDIKPGNLFLAGDPTDRTVRILDFGIARMGTGDGNQELTELTRTGSMLGSPQYMAPEQARGSKSVDSRADIWSLGVVLYRLLSATLPHKSADGVGGLLVAICTQPAPPIQTRAPWVPPEVADIVHTALQMRREDRYPSARAMHEAIVALLPNRSCKIDEQMLVMLTNAERSYVAPVARPIRPASAEPEADTEAAVETRAVPHRPTSRWRTSWVAIGSAAVGVAIAVGVGKLALQKVQPHAAAVAPAPAELTVKLHIPLGAQIEVDGVPVEATGDSIVLRGPERTAKVVRATQNGQTVEATIGITSMGAVPSSLAFPPLPAAAQPAAPSTGMPPSVVATTKGGGAAHHPTTTTTKSAPATTAATTPPSSLRTNFE